MGAMAACAPVTDCAIRETGSLSRVPGGWNCVQQPDVEHLFPRGVGATNTKASAVGGVGSLGQTNVLKRSKAWDDSTSFCDRRVALRDVTYSNDRCGSIASFWPWAEDFRCSAISGHAKRPILRQKYPTASECARRHLSFRAIGRRHAERNERIGAVMGERPVFGRVCP
jgi:hypothetical protein